MTNLQLESQIKVYFSNKLRKIGVHYINLIHTGSKGDPDKMILLPGGRVWFVEFKRPGGIISPPQAYKINLYRELGFPVYVVRSKSDADVLYNEIQSALLSNKRKSILSK